MGYVSVIPARFLAKTQIFKVQDYLQLHNETLFLK